MGSLKNIGYQLWMAASCVLYWHIKRERERLYTVYPGNIMATPLQFWNVGFSCSTFLNVIKMSPPPDNCCCIFQAKIVIE